MVTGALACICVIMTLVIVVKQIKLQSLVSSLGIMNLIPLTKAYYLFETLTKTTEAPYYLARSIQNEQVVCSHPLLTALGSAIAICGAIYAAYQVFQSLSCYCGYKNSKCFMMYCYIRRVGLVKHIPLVTILFQDKQLLGSNVILYFFIPIVTTLIHGSKKYNM